MGTNVVTSYPGVYIEELFNLSLSVTAGATAVPIFADSNVNPDLTTAVRCNSWLDFITAMEKSPGTGFKPDNLLHVSVRAYFENGGGYCYLVCKDQMAAEVPKFDDITLLIAAGQDISSAVNILCQPSKSLFAILDAPTDLLSGSVSATKNNHAAMYYPHLEADWADIPVPPSAVMAGIYCSVDRERGVWKAPANVSIKGGLRPVVKVTDRQQGDHNEDGKIAVNMIRDFRNVGTLVWGARTMGLTPDWRYVPVRRLFDTAERDIKRVARFAVFEPNTGVTWTRVKSAIESYLHNIWQMGGLMGSRPEEGYFVQMGEGITMTRDDVLSGKMIVKIGLAAVRPAEFIILQFTQEVGQA